jgi:hypothetical protein
MSGRFAIHSRTGSIMPAMHEQKIGGVGATQAQTSLQPKGRDTALVALCQWRAGDHGDWLAPGVDGKASRSARYW